MHSFVDIILGIAQNLGYPGIFIMMTIESSFIPFPSEVAMVPAGYLVALWKMNFFLAFLAGTLGAMLGSCINYGLGKYLWGPVVKKLIHQYGKYIFLSENHYLQAEKYFKSHGAITTFVGRFIPAVRQLISLPAWVFQMNFMKFLVFTFAGAGIWNIILLSIGYIAGKNDDLVQKLLSQTLIFVLVICGAIIFMYVKYVKKHAKELRAIEREIERNDME